VQAEENEEFVDAVTGTFVCLQSGLPGGAPLQKFIELLSKTITIGII
jgi:hypothetical protein